MTSENFGKPERRTFFIADLKCYMCGSVSGSIESEQSLAEAAHKEANIRRPLGKPPHQVRVPLFAIRQVHPHAVALLHEPQLQIASDAEQHLEVEAIGRNVLALGNFASEADQFFIVRGD